jgi:uroporphyrinogen-III decarboxylase
LAGQNQIRKRAYRDFGQTYDQQVLDRLRDAEIRILHLTADRPFFDLAARYSVQAVCWNTWQSDPPIADARNQFRGALMGGLNPLTFAGGSEGDVRHQITDAVEQSGGWRFLLSPSSALPVESRAELLATVHQTLVEL